MIDELTNAELARLRRAFRYLDDQAEPAVDLARLVSPTEGKAPIAGMEGGGGPWDDGQRGDRQRGPRVMAMAAAAAVIAATGGGWLLSQRHAEIVVAAEPAAEADSVPAYSDPADSDLAARSVPADSEVVDDATFLSDPSSPPNQDGVYDLVVDPADGTHYAIRRNQVVRSDDEGATWEPLREPGDDDQFELVTFGPDGALIALTKSVTIDQDVLAPGFRSNGPVKVVRLDPASEQWHEFDLPRPDLPNAAQKPMAESGDCPLFGGQSFVSPRDVVVVGRRMVVVGDHRVVADGICDELQQVLWTSSDGTTWTLEQSGLGVTDGAVTGLQVVGDTVVAYGDKVAVADPTWDEVRIWTSADLETWTPVVIDTEAEGVPAQATVRAEDVRIERSSDGRIRLGFPVVRIGAEIDADLADMDQLLDVLQEYNRHNTRDELKDLIGDVTFPLSDEEVTNLRNTFGRQTSLGVFEATSDVTGTSWTFDYRAGQ